MTVDLLFSLVLLAPAWRSGQVHSKTLRTVLGASHSQRSSAHVGTCKRVSFWDLDQYPLQVLLKQNFPGKLLSRVHRSKCNFVHSSCAVHVPLNYARGRNMWAM
ncbi:hypothetical protein F5148DRAFT_1192360 [Russula earlei]|uniref:Uncharacterized protein n=1 Tax=Russula earlei TaxID=71964 RepID=A0ACC0UAW5_9AGAM|nr:hypothetical protein F5148DRAFT_1192360 [Russula earlei]